MKAIFITGTDTGVGKTFVSAALAAYLSIKKQIDVGVMKPFESGVPKSENPLMRDASLLKFASGSTDTLEEITPYRFEAPLAPQPAAQRDGTSINLSVVNEHFERLKASHEILIVEGAGGILVPITEDYFFADLIKRWNVQVLVVARLGLGTINHTLLTVKYLQAISVPVAGVVLNNAEGSADEAARSNPEVLANYLKVPILGILPTMQELDLSTESDRHFLADICEKYISAETIVSLLR